MERLRRANGRDSVRRSPRAGVVCACLALALSACSGGRHADAAAPHASTTRAAATTTTEQPRADAATLVCRDTLGAQTVPVTDYSVVLDRVALVTRRVLQTSPSGDPSPSAKLFAKQGLLVAPGAHFELRVPDDWTKHFSIAWGKPGKRTTDLVVAGCPAAAPGAAWLGFAGGFWVDGPVCAPLIVKTEDRQTLVHIAVGAPCPSP